MRRSRCPACRRFIMFDETAPDIECSACGAKLRYNEVDELELIGPAKPVQSMFPPTPAQMPKSLPPAPIKPVPPVSQAPKAPTIPVPTQSAPPAPKAAPLQTEQVTQKPIQPPAQPVTPPVQQPQIPQAPIAQPSDVKKNQDALDALLDDEDRIGRVTTPKEQKVSAYSDMLGEATAAEVKKPSSLPREMPEPIVKPEKVNDKISASKLAEQMSSAISEDSSVIGGNASGTANVIEKQAYASMIDNQPKPQPQVAQTLPVQPQVQAPVSQAQIPQAPIQPQAKQEIPPKPVIEAPKILPPAKPQVPVKPAKPDIFQAQPQKPTQVVPKSIVAEQKPTTKHVDKKKTESRRITKEEILSSEFKTPANLDTFDDSDESILDEIYQLELEIAALEKKKKVEKAEAELMAEMENVGELKEWDSSEFKAVDTNAVAETKPSFPPKPAPTKKQPVHKPELAKKQPKPVAKSPAVKQSNPAAKPKRKRKKDAEILKELGVGEGQNAIKEARKAVKIKYYYIRISQPDNKKVKKKLLASIKELNLPNIDENLLEKNLNSAVPYFQIGKSLTKKHAYSVLTVLKKLKLVGSLKEE